MQSFLYSCGFTKFLNHTFPAFLGFLSEGIEENNLSQELIVLQQHPGAKALGRDRKLLQAWVEKYGNHPHAPHIVFSEETTEDMQVLADAALYYQTSMGPVFALSGMGTIQVAHKTYPDVLVRGKICPSVTDGCIGSQAVHLLQPQGAARSIYSSIAASND